MTTLFQEAAKKKPDRNAEGRLQIAIVEYVRWIAPHVVIFHVPNGGWRTRAEAARFKAMGALAGVPDLVLALPGGRTAFWEVKTEEGRISEAQEAVIDHLVSLDHPCGVIRSIDDARASLELLGIKTREAMP